MGLLERHGEVRTMVVRTPSASRSTAKFSQHVEAGSTVYSDALRSYNQA